MIRTALDNIPMPPSSRLHSTRSMRPCGDHANPRITCGPALSVAPSGSAITLLIGCQERAGVSGKSGPSST